MAKNKNYFTKETQKYIILYQNESDRDKRASIYEEHICPAFVELVHNLVSVYKFKSANEDIVHLKNDCMSFLYETILKWNPDKGTKAFSYFNVVAKNWLTIQTRKLLKISRKSVYFEEQDSFTPDEKSYLQKIEFDTEEIEKEKKIKVSKTSLEVIEHIRKHLKDENDIKCVHAIKTVFENVDSLDFLNKRAIFVYLREISGLNSTELSSSLSSIRKIYRKSVGPDKIFDIFNL